jgi:hypothetical protein
MEIVSLLSESKEDIIEEWFDAAVRVYPPDTASFLKKKNNRFANPVGYNFLQAMEASLGYLVGQKKGEEVLGALEGLVKIKAVQDFSASQAVKFIFILKDVIRKRAGGPSEELLEIESRVDELALVCFDIYMRSKEKLNDLRASELRKMHYRLLERANIATRIDDSGRSPDGGNGS